MINFFQYLEVLKLYCRSSYWFSHVCLSFDIIYVCFKKVCNTLFLFGSLVLTSELKVFKKEKDCLMKKRKSIAGGFLIERKSLSDDTFLFLRDSYI